MVGDSIILHFTLYIIINKLKSIPSPQEYYEDYEERWIIIKSERAQICRIIKP